MPKCEIILTLTTNQTKSGTVGLTYDKQVQKFHETRKKLRRNQYRKGTCMQTVGTKTDAPPVIKDNMPTVVTCYFMYVYDAGYMDV